MPNEKNTTFSPGDALPTKHTRQKKEDKRVRYTKIFLKEALLKLLLEKPLGEITPTELCREADINRNTFYSHFSAVRDVLDMVENELEEKLMSTLSFGENSLEMVHKIIQNIAQNDKEVRIIFSPNGDIGFGKKLYELVEEKALREFEKTKPGIDDTTMRYAFSFAFLGSTAIIQRWLHDNMQRTPEEISKLIFNLSKKGLDYYLA